MLLLLAALLLPPPADGGPLPEAWKAPQDWISRALRYMETNPETLEELTSKSHAVLQGDIVQPDDRNAVQSLWPTLEIPFVISPDLASRTDDILAAMAMLSERTCVSFHPRTSETNYLSFRNSKGCASYVGFIGGEQDVFVGPPCKTGNIVHELLHALGFFHEHTRADRSQHVKILSENIMPGMERNFVVQEGQTFSLPYDLQSILHYGGTFFTANGLPTLVPYAQVEGMGQRVRLTETDVERVRHLYSCDFIEKGVNKEGGAGRGRGASRGRGAAAGGRAAD